DTEIALPERRSNRPITLGHRVEFIIARILLGFFRVIGIDAASFIAGKFLRITGPLIRPASRRGEENLRMAFPDWSDKKINAVMKDVWENLGRTGAEYAHLDKLHVSGENPRIISEGRDRVVDAFKNTNRAVFVTGHFANWEVSGIAAHQQELKFAVIYRALNNPLLDEWIIEKRGQVMTRRQIPKGIAGARPLIDALKQDYSLAFLADQKLNTGGIRVPFMGFDAMTAPAAARIAVRFNLPVIPNVVERLNGAYFKVTSYDPIEFLPSGDLVGDVEALTIKINEFLETEIRKNPGQWLWLHRRWAIKGEPGAANGGRE
ncbi:MAG: lysophospholipid acyltransferase family protein, partial [Marinicaulis sp.]|nr:lysophospholipid acyltransferase family protein [Marinicaulis sp.]